MIYPSKSKRFVHSYFTQLERVLAAKSAAIVSSHKGDRGDSRESILAECLNDHLPLIARAHKGGAILDVRDDLSSQIDIVVYSNWAPLMRQTGKPLFLSSGCYAAIEVKSVLTTETIRDLFALSQRIKSMLKFLGTPSDGGLLVMGNTSASICVGLFAYKSAISRETVFAVMHEFEDANVPNYLMPDFICLNGQWCLTRHRTEDASGYHPPQGSGEKPTLDEWHRRVMYRVSESSLVAMLESVLEYVSYIGPMRDVLESYSRHWWSMSDSSVKSRRKPTRRTKMKT